MSMRFLTFSTSGSFVRFGSAVDMALSDDACLSGIAHAVRDCNAGGHRSVESDHSVVHVSDAASQ